MAGGQEQDPGPSRLTIVSTGPLIGVPAARVAPAGSDSSGASAPGPLWPAEPYWSRQRYLDNPGYVCSTVGGVTSTLPAVRDGSSPNADPLAPLVLGWTALTA